MAKVLITKELADTLKSIRLQNNIRSKDLAEKINKSPAYITKLEKCEIQTISFEELTKIFTCIVSTDGSMEETMKEVYNSLKFKYTDKEISEQIWFSNYDTVQRRIPIPDSLIDEINKILHINNIPIKYLLNRINSNESLSDDDKANDDIPYNQWYSPEGKAKGAQSIKIKMSIDTLEDILNKSIDVTNYICMLSIVFYLLKIERFNEKTDILPDEETDVMEEAIAFLSKHKFYSLTSKDEALSKASSHEEQLELLTSFDKKNYELVNSILRKIKYMSNDDIKIANKCLEEFHNNLNWNLGFTFKMLSLPFYELGDKHYTIKKEFINDVETLLQKYISSPEEKNIIEKY